MVVSIFILSMQYNNRGLSGKVIRHVSKNTLGIYLLHRIVGALIKPFFMEFSFFSTFIGGMVFAGAVLFLCLLIIYILKKVPYFNYLFSLKLKLA
jgi:surface polysaccharide O-acyltransferase-like enzyme